jgi:HD-GYP domain-containing protein (c-di-GMP phosphodiesterase class II)
VLGLGDLPPALRTYLLAVGLTGPILALVALFAADASLPTIEGHELLAAVLLTGLATTADRYQFHLTHKTSINVTTACFVAMLLVLPLSILGVLVYATILGGHLLRRADPAEALFNAAVGALEILAAGLCLAALASVNEYLALGLAVTVMHLVNTGLVAVAAGLQLGTNPWRTWFVTFADDLPAQIVLTLLGLVAATVVETRPLLVPVLALPVYLVHRAQQQAVRLGADTREALASLVEIVELRDPYTAGHSRRVAETARTLALRLGLTHEEADSIESAGRVHDIGKVAIDPAVLTKPGKLDDDEWVEMKRHPGYGADVIARIAAYPEGHRLVRHHHEAWDGTGYPDGVSGEAIPLGARILAVADTFDALTSDRPYRQGMDLEHAVAILSDGAGKQWDARIVDALVAHLAETHRPAPSLETAPVAPTLVAAGQSG